jgi:hypothetical protein
MLNEYFKDYADHTTDAWAMRDFGRYCQMNLRIPFVDAENLLRRREVENSRQYNTDTTMAIVCNDGHGGTSIKFVDLYINFQPEFLTTSIPDAIEGQVYNPKRDSIIAVRIFDANRDQRHTFQLIYDNYPLNEIPLDPSFPVETMMDIRDMKTTPD